jgi:hypothetical protein
MAIASAYDDYNIAIYLADGSHPYDEECEAVAAWMKEHFDGGLAYHECNIGLTGYWPTMWNDMAEITTVFPHLMFEVYMAPAEDDRQQWYFSDGKVAEAEEITKWSDYNPAELRPIFSGGKRGN